jgi:hypothetical protein
MTISLPNPQYHSCTKNGEDRTTIISLLRYRQTITTNAWSIPVTLDDRIIPRLQFEPVPFGHAEVMREAMSDVGGDRSLSLDDLVDASRRDIDISGQMPDAYSSRGEEVF